MTDLPELTDKQYNFVKGILSGLTASDAYRQSYDCRNTSAPAIHVAASRLKTDAKIALWLAMARQHALDSATVTLEGHTAELERLKALALEKDNYGAAVKAEELRGKANGLYVDKHEDVTPKQATQDILKELEQINPQLAQLLRTETVN